MLRQSKAVEGVWRTQRARPGPICTQKHVNVGVSCTFELLMASARANTTSSARHRAALHENVHPAMLRLHTCRPPRMVHGGLKPQNAHRSTAYMQGQTNSQLRRWTEAGGVLEAIYSCLGGAAPRPEDSHRKERKAPHGCFFCFVMYGRQGVRVFGSGVKRERAPPGGR